MGAQTKEVHIAMYVDTHPCYRSAMALCSSTGPDNTMASNSIQAFLIRPFLAVFTSPVPPLF